jgi:hypothetical protein
MKNSMEFQVNMLPYSTWQCANDYPMMYRLVETRTSHYTTIWDNDPLKCKQ